MTNTIAGIILISTVLVGCGLGCLSILAEDHWWAVLVYLSIVILILLAVLSIGVILIIGG